MVTKRKTIRSAMTPAERAALAFDVYMRAYEATESFEAENVGSDLAYLMGAILSPHAESVLWGKSEGLAILKILRQACPPKHKVWSFIDAETN